MSYNLVAVVQNLSYAIIFDRNNIETPIGNKKVLNMGDFKNHVKNLLLERINGKINNYQRKSELMTELNTKLKLLDNVEPWDTIIWQLLEHSENGPCIKISKIHKKYKPT